MFNFFIGEDKGIGDKGWLVKVVKIEAPPGEGRLDGCFDFFGSFFVSFCNAGFAREQISRNFSLGSMRLWRAQPTSSGERPTTGFPLDVVVFVERYSVERLSGGFFGLVLDNQEILVRQLPSMF